MPSLSAVVRLRRLTLAALVANVAIVLTGGVVRLTGSGLGCPDWPTCSGTSVIPRAGVETAGWHQAIEFGNRVLAAVVLAIAVAVLVAAWRRGPWPRGVLGLAVALAAGVFGQALLGGATVLTGLNPLVVAIHFLVSMVLIAIAVVLHQRMRRFAAHDAQPRETDAGRDVRGHAPQALRWLSRALVAATAVVLTIGTLVTAAGPHAGDPGTTRLALDIRTVALLHADAVWLLVGLTLATLLTARVTGATQVARGAGALLALELAQGAVGYSQFALGIPAELVAVHLLGACLVWIAAVTTWHAASRPQPEGATASSRRSLTAAARP